MNKTLLLLHGPNLNLLGKRDRTIYGILSLAELQELTRRRAQQYGLELLCYQSNHEGDIIDFLQQKASACCGIIINAGALTHYSYSLYDALLDADKPTIEVHLSNLEERESWRQCSVILPACLAQIYGKQEQGYLLAVEKIAAFLLKSGGKFSS
jgi:3-dehydroquinate dehydratase II